jgi:hypothetical protein
MKFYVARTVVLALCIVLAGCDSTQFLYNRAHWLLGYQADRYLDLDQVQTVSVNQKLNHWLNWHRRTQLICYAELIIQFETRARTTLTRADIIWLESELKLYYEAAIFSATPPIAQILGDLNSEQIDHLEKRLAKDHAKLARQVRTDDESRLQRRAKKTVGGLKKWFGHLSRTQVAWIEQHSMALPDTYASWLEYREQRDGSLIDLLRANTDPQTIADTIKLLWTGAESPAADKLEALMADMMSQSKKLAIDFYAMASAEQKAHFWRRLNNYRSDFLQLASADTTDAACELAVMRLTDERIGNDGMVNKITAIDEV